MTEEKLRTALDLSIKIRNLKCEIEPIEIMRDKLHDMDDKKQITIELPGRYKNEVIRIYTEMISDMQAESDKLQYEFKKL